jgi:hypothetical protein
VVLVDTFEINIKSLVVIAAGVFEFGAERADGGKVGIGALEMIESLAGRAMGTRGQEFLDLVADATRQHVQAGIGDDGSQAGTEFLARRVDLQHGEEAFGRDFGIGGFKVALDLLQPRGDRLLYQRLLYTRKINNVDLYAHIASRNHDAVAYIQYIFNIVYAALVLYLRYY